MIFTYPQGLWINLWGSFRQIPPARARDSLSLAAGMRRKIASN